MSQEQQDSKAGGRSELPIERGFPIERVNEIAEKESRAKQHYRPIYTMHKWWARRPGCLFRAITLYSLLDDETDLGDVAVYEPGENQTLGTNGVSKEDLLEAIGEVDMEDPEALWEFYPKDVRIKNKKILDPFMGGGTSLVEASRFGVESVGYDLNPVAWFVTKKQLDAGQTDVEKLEEAFRQVKEDVADEITQYYKTPCPNSDGDHDADVMYYFWVKELDCTSCGNVVPLYRDFRIGKGRYENDDKYNVLCPNCESIFLVDDYRSDCICEHCDHEFLPEEGNVDYGDYICTDCGQRYPVTDRIQERDGFDLRLYALEYYCPHCDEQGESRSEVKGYKTATETDLQLYNEAKQRWESSDPLQKYVPDKPIRPGWKTDANHFEGTMPGNGNLPRHGIHKWTDMYNERQLLCLSIIQDAISEIDDNNLREFLILSLTESLRYSNLMASYNTSHNKIGDMFRTNSYDPPTYPVENNVWGTKWGSGTFSAMFDMVKKGVEYAKSPNDRHVTGSGTKKVTGFNQPVGKNTVVNQGDMRFIDWEDEFDAVITDPPYYNNILYSELSDYFHVWLKPMLEGEYDCFETEHTPRSESIVVNPASGKGIEEFESELKQAFSRIRTALKEDGVVAFTYHHSNAESWGELLESLCETGFEVTATYPINSDLNKFTKGEAISFDIVIVARPAEERRPISWNSLRRRIHKTAQETRNALEENRDLKPGDIGVIEMGKCFQEYSQHHGEVHRAGEIMTAKEVVDEIYGIIQESDRGEQDVYVDLLEQYEPTYDDLNKHLKGSNASEEVMREMRLFRVDGNDFVLGDWDDEKRQAYVRTKVDEGNGDLTDLDRAHFLRYRYEEGKSTSEFLERWDTDSIQELCEGLAEATGDDTYLKMLGVDTSLLEFTDE